MCAIQYFVSKFTNVSGVDMFPVGTSCGQAPDPTAAFVEAQLIETDHCCLAILSIPNFLFPEILSLNIEKSFICRQLHLVVIMFET